MTPGHRTGLDITKRMKATAPTSSYWATGCTRAELMQRITERRSQQRLPTESELNHDPLLHATAALADHKWRATK